MPQLVDTNTIVKISLSVSTDNTRDISGSLNVKQNKNDENYEDEKVDNNNEESTIGRFTNESFSYIGPSVSSTVNPSSLIKKEETH